MESLKRGGEKGKKEKKNRGREVPHPYLNLLRQPGALAGNPGRKGGRGERKREGRK